MDWEGSRLVSPTQQEEYQHGTHKNKQRRQTTQSQTSTEDERWLDTQTMTGVFNTEDVKDVAVETKYVPEKPGVWEANNKSSILEGRIVLFYENPISTCGRPYSQRNRQEIVHLTPESSKFGSTTGIAKEESKGAVARLDTYGHHLMTRQTIGKAELHMSQRES